MLRSVLVLVGLAFVFSGNSYAISGGFSLSEAAEMALGHDDSYQAEVERYQAEKEKLPQARSVFFPKIDFVAGRAYEEVDNIYTDEDSYYYDPDSSRSKPEVWDTMWRFSVNQTLFDYSAIAGYQAAGKEVTAAGHKLQQARQQLIAKTAEAYLNVLHKAQVVYLNQSIYDALGHKLEQARRASELGIGGQLEVLEVQARRDLTRNDLLLAQSELEDEQAKLAILTGRQLSPPDHWFSEERFSNTRLSDMDPLFDEAYWLDKASLNQEYLYSQELAYAARLRNQVNKGAHLPVVSLSVNYSYRKSDDEFRDRKGWGGTVEIRLPLFSGGSTSSKVREGAARYRSQLASSESLLKEGRQSIALAYGRIRNLAKRLDALKVSVESSKRYLEAAERGAALNLRSHIDILDARTQLLETELKFTDAVNSYLQADLDLHYQSGVLGLERMAYYDKFFVVQ